MLTDEEKLLFHHQGYVILRNVLTPAQVAALNAAASQMPVATQTADVQQREFFVCSWGQEFLDLVDQPRVMPWMEWLCGPKFRLDHDYCIFMNPGIRGSRLHGGEPDFGDFWYRTDSLGNNLSGLTVVTYFLGDAPEGAGGFVCVPGSHRGNFLRDIPDDVLQQKVRPSYIVQPAFSAGDAVVFAEGLIHGTGAWNGPQQRRVLLYKYVPGHIAWVGNFYDAAKFPSLTERQRKIMRPPYVELIRQPNGTYRSDTLASDAFETSAVVAS